MHNYVTNTGLRCVPGHDSCQVMSQKMHILMLSAGHDKADTFYYTVPAASENSVSTSASGLYLTGDWFESLQSNAYPECEYY